jgi:hypothetical protein
MSWNSFHFPLAGGIGSVQPPSRIVCSGLRRGRGLVRRALQTEYALLAGLAALALAAGC